MRRPTAIVLVLLVATLLVVAILQLTQDPPDTPYPGPVSDAPLPPGITDAASTSAS